MGECLRVMSASLCSSQFVYLYMRVSVCVYIYSVIFCLRPSWEIDLSNQWPLEITSLLLFLLLLLLLLSLLSLLSLLLLLSLLFNSTLNHLSFTQSNCPIDSQHFVISRYTFILQSKLYKHM